MDRHRDVKVNLNSNARHKMTLDSLLPEQGNAIRYSSEGNFPSMGEVHQHAAIKPSMAGTFPSMGKMYQNGLIKDR